MLVDLSREIYSGVLFTLAASKINITKTEIMDKIQKAFIIPSLRFHF